MGLFDKKYCDICGEKIGLLGNRKLEDGNLCKDCASKLSPWFDERRHSTVDMIRDQLKYRENNQTLADAFHVTRTFGDAYQVLMIDEQKKQFAVARMQDMPSGNPDIVSCTDILDCSLDPKEYKTELFMKDKEGHNVSYNPKRYEYSYDFYFVIHVNAPYFDEMRFQLNKNRIVMREATTAQRVSGVLSVLAGQSNSVSLMNPEYDKYLALGDEMKNTLMMLRNGTVPAAYGAVGAQAQSFAAADMTGGKWVCQACNAENEGGAFCEYCGTKRQ